MERRLRALDVARRAGAEALLASKPSTVAWLTGFAGEVDSGPSPFSLPALALLAGDDPPILIVSDDDADAAAATGCDVRSYRGFSVEPLDPVGGARGALAGVAGRRRVAVEAGALPAAIAADLDWVGVDGELARSRAVKDADELPLIRAAIELCDVGQREARRRAEPGLTELELWAFVRAAIESAAGSRTPLLADLVAGPRTAEVGGAPEPRVLAEGELVLCDLVPRRSGYWGDSCATFALGEPSADARARHRRVSDRLAKVLDAVRPGVVAAELDALAREGLDYPHHSGHGLGCDWHEEPRIVPASETVIEAGMVVALEPAWYEGTEGVRLEQVVLVTPDGCEILSGHGLEL
ncbi:MAG TPA: Xaa-Pro peptidase family protein [Gaiellaceae bacterium]|nr:Xaa-Pro peptidase family protein [Gaiellaceae bacterium]